MILIVLVAVLILTAVSTVQILGAEPENGDSSDKPSAKSAEKEAKDQAAKEGDPNAQQATGEPVQTNDNKKQDEPKVWCPPGFKVVRGECNKDIFINVHKNVKTNTVTDPTAPRYITDTLVDCNVVAATPAYFSPLAIQTCNFQYHMNIM
jgi:hypothetical protein